MFDNGTDVVFTVRPQHPWTSWTTHPNPNPLLQYHGIMQMKVEDGTSPSRSGRKASVHVAGWGAEHRRASVEVNLRPSLCGEALFVVKAHV